jgi:hypothetical protein
MDLTGSSIKIIGRCPEFVPYVMIEMPGDKGLYLDGRDLETFAVNVLRALKSKHLNILP